MLSQEQKAILADAMWAVTDSATAEGSEPKGGFFYALTHPFESYVAGQTLGATSISVTEAHTQYVEIFAMGDAATSDDFKRFMSLAKLVATRDNWQAYDLDDRWNALPSQEQGPSEIDIALDKAGIPRPGTWGDKLAALGSWAKWMLWGGVALVGFLVVGRFSR